MTTHGQESNPPSREGQPNLDAARGGGDPWSAHNARVQDWLESAEADADRRGLPELKPILRLLARSTTALRAADWNTRE